MWQSGLASVKWEDSQSPDHDVRHRHKNVIADVNASVISAMHRADQSRQLVALGVGQHDMSTPNGGGGSYRAVRHLPILERRGRRDAPCSSRPALRHSLEEDPRAMTIGVDQPPKLTARLRLGWPPTFEADNLLAARRCPELLLSARRA